jgi:hypothetical protein
LLPTDSTQPELSVITQRGLRSGKGLVQRVYRAQIDCGGVT